MEDLANWAASAAVIKLTESLAPFFQIITGVFTVVIAFSVHIHSRRMARLQSQQTIVDSWMRFDSLILTDPESMAAYNKISGSEPTEDYKVDWIIYYYVNQAYHAYLAHSYGGVPRQNLDFELDTVWRNVVHSETRVIEILGEGGYPPEFVSYFIRHRKRLPSK